MPSWFSSHLVCGARSGKPDTGDISQQNGRLQHAHDAPIAEHDLEGEDAGDGQVCLQPHRCQQLHSALPFSMNAESAWATVSACLAALHACLDMYTSPDTGPANVCQQTSTQTHEGLHC